VSQTGRLGWPVKCTLGNVFCHRTKTVDLSFMVSTPIQLSRSNKVLVARSPNISKLQPAFLPSLTAFLTIGT
jgi:hypothetical protein